MFRKIDLNKYLFIPVAVIAVLGISEFNSFSRTINIQAKSSAILSRIEGKVYILENNKWVNLIKGNIIKINNQIKTDNKSKAEITFSDGSKVRLSENTSIVLIKERKKEKEQHGLLKIFSGKLWANVFSNNKSRFSIQSNTAALAVLGTTFNVEAENKETDISVFEGSVGIQKPTNDNEEFNKKLDNLKLIIDDKKSTNVQKPDKIDKPIEVEKPFKVIDGPHQISMNEWLEIIANQKITVDEKGVGTVVEIKEQEIKEDEWVQWNKELDSNTSENILFDK